MHLIRQARRLFRWPRTPLRLRGASMKQMSFAVVALGCALFVAPDCRAQLHISFEFTPRSNQLAMTTRIADPNARHVTWFAPGKRDNDVEGMSSMSMSANTLGDLKRQIGGKWLLRVRR